MGKDTLLKRFVFFLADRSDLKKELGEDLFNVKAEPYVLTAKDVTQAIEKYLHDEITTDALVDWVNTIWFTDLFAYSETEEDSIASVMCVLETLDEEGVVLLPSDAKKMIECLKRNVIYTE